MTRKTTNGGSKRTRKATSGGKRERHQSLVGRVARSIKTRIKSIFG